VTPQQESPYEVVILIASCAVLVTASVLVVRFDERRLERAAENGDEVAQAQLEWAWSPPSRDNALIGLALLGAPVVGLFAVWFHFVRTRTRGTGWPFLRSAWGFFLGILAVFAIMAANAAVVLTLAYALGLPLED
jgi:hypothetical protein